jgi:hypothetical protein
MPLSDLQRRCATIILQLPEAAGFALAGGAALLVHEVTDRGTNDIDCFGPSVAAVDALAPAAIAALTDAGLDVEVVVMANGFAKLVVVDGSERTQVDLGFDPATNAAVLTSVGPVRSLADLAGDKLLALFARAASRDFVDVSALLEHFSREDMLRLAAAKDRGFSREVLAGAFRVLPTYDRGDEFPSLSDHAYGQLLATFWAWEAELRSGAADP